MWPAKKLVTIIYTHRMNTIEELLEMNLEKLSAMTDAEILAYLQPYLTIQPPMLRASGSGGNQDKGTRVKLGSGTGSVKELGQKLINRGPSQIDNAFVDLMKNLAAASGQALDVEALAAATTKKGKK